MNKKKKYQYPYTLEDLKEMDLNALSKTPQQKMMRQSILEVWKKQVEDSESDQSVTTSK